MTINFNAIDRLDAIKIFLDHCIFELKTSFHGADSAKLYEDGEEIADVTLRKVG